MNKEPTIIQSDERLFWPRTSEAVVELAKLLQSEPERPLTDEEKSNVLAFEAELFVGRYSDDILTDSPMAELKSISDTTVQLVPEYFTTSEGRTELQDNLGISLNNSDDEQHVTQQLCALPLDTLQHPDHKKKLQALQGKSLNYLKSAYADMAHDHIEARDIATVTLIKDPEHLFDRATALRENKRFLHHVRKDLRAQDESNLNAAKLMITDIYRDKLNAQIALLYPNIMHVVRQYEASEQTIDEKQYEEMSIMLKTVSAAKSLSNLHDQFLRMLDYVRNGAAVDEDGKFTPIDEKIFDDVYAINNVPTENIEAYFSDEQIAQFENYVFDSLKMKEFLEAYLKKMGLAQHDWTIDVRSSSNTFNVDSADKQVNQPDSYESTIMSTGSSAGVIGLIEHEIGGRNPGHVVQSVNAENNPLQLKIAQSAKARGKRYLSMREAGGIHSESEAAKFYFGKTRRATGSYAHAMRTLLEGGTHADAVRSFAESQLAGREDVSENDIAAAYKTGADRVMRLLRHGGRNSQPLQYVEAATVRRVAEDMPSDMVDTMFSEAVFDPVDMMRLHQFGLLETASDHRFEPDRPAEEIIAELLNQHVTAK